MASMWESPAYVKVHEGCGGRVRWVEAINSPGIGYTGDCCACSAQRIPTEAIVPIEVRGDLGGFNGQFDIREAVLGTSQDQRAELAWDDDLAFEANQERIRSELGVPA